MKKRRKENLIFGFGIVLTFLAGTVSLTGCNIRMTASERVGIQEEPNKEQTQEEIQPEEKESEEKEEEITELPILKVTYKPYDLYDLAEIAFGMDKKDVDAKKEEGMPILYLTPMEDFPMGNTGIMIYTDDSGCSIRWEDGAENYRYVMSNAAQALGGGNDLDDGTYYFHFYSFAPSKLERAFPSDEEKTKLLEEAADEVTGLLRQMGMTPAWWYGCIPDAEFWKRYRDAGLYFREGFIPEDDICLFIFKQEFKGILIDDINTESLIHVAYSAADNRMLLLDTWSPGFGEVLSVSEEPVTLLSGKDAEILGEDILINEYDIRNPVLTDVRLVYITPIIGGVDAENQIITLYPAWKVSYQIPIGNKIVNDYILLNAENGIQYTNAMPLY